VYAHARICRLNLSASIHSPVSPCLHPREYAAVFASDRQARISLARESRPSLREGNGFVEISSGPKSHRKFIRGKVRSIKVRGILPKNVLEHSGESNREEAIGTSRGNFSVIFTIRVSSLTLESPVRTRGDHVGLNGYPHDGTNVLTSDRYRRKRHRRSDRSEARVLASASSDYSHYGHMLASPASVIEPPKGRLKTGKAPRSVHPLVPPHPPSGGAGGVLGGRGSEATAK